MPKSLIASRNKGRRIYLLARTFLFQLKAPGLTRAVIESYFIAPVSRRPTTLAGIYERLLGSGQNANMKAGVVGGSIGGVGKLGPLLSNFEPVQVVAHYGIDSKRLLKDIIKRLKPHGKIRKKPRSIWPQYCRTVLSAAEFLSRFESATDFYAWIDFFDADARARPGLPLIICEEVQGIGFALACDFLMELGYANFGKPDVHIREIFNAAGLCCGNASDYERLRAICRVAESADVSPYTVDKVFWLIGSGFFYNHPQIGNAGRIPQPKARFIGLLAVQATQGPLRACGL